MKNRTIFNFFLFVCVFFLFFLPLIAQQDTPLEIEKVAGNVYCLYGPGGNMGILETDEGLLVVDSKYLKIAEKVIGKIAGLSPKPIKYLINTHYHGDHTSGNEVIGQNAEVFAHKNCKASLINSLKSQKSAQEFASRIKTFEKEMTLKPGGENVKLLYFNPAHSSGDTIVVFETYKVIHTGDLFFNGIPPYIDVKDGSDTENWIRIIELLNNKFPDYRVIPGHGKVTDMRRFLRFAEYLKFLRTEVGKAIKAGKSKKQVMEEISFDSFPDIEDRGFMTKKNNAGWVYDEMTRKK